MNSFTRIRIFLLVPLVLIINLLKAQSPDQVPVEKPLTFTGILVDSSNRGIAYAGMGIPGKPIGTVTDSSGHFSLDIPSDNLMDSLKISCIGYKTKLVKIQDLPKPWNKLNLILATNTTQLLELSVNGSPGSDEQIGRNSDGKLIQLGMFGKNPKSIVGAEMGLEFNAQRHPAWLKNVNFNISENNFAHIKFRILLYSLKNHKPDTLLDQKPVYINVDKKKTGWVYVDLTWANIILEQDCFVSIQWVENSPFLAGKDPVFNVPAALSLSHTLYFRGSSQDTWKKMRGNMSFYVTFFD